MLQNSMRTSDLLRWEMLRHGLLIDRPPDICDPETGAEPPELETVIRLRELAEESKEREEEEMEDDEIIKVPAFSEMDADIQRQHCELRHHVAMNEARHTVQHAAGLSPDHIHKPDAMQRRMALAADIRFKKPVFGDTAYLNEESGE
jgi:hypothetical protein